MGIAIGFFNGFSSKGGDYVNIKRFLKLVEIQTKVASMIPLVLGTAYTVYRFDSFYLHHFWLMFISLLCIDMATTAVNNYQDYKRAIKKSGFGYESHNAIVKYNLKESVVLMIILLLLVFASVLGIILVIHTNNMVLLLGGISFFIGILYSYGPVPISHTPFGEIFSGVFMGLIIPFLSIYIHIYDQDIIGVFFQDGILSVSVNLVELAFIILISIPAVVGIANIMLANNICDVEDDIENERHTLVTYIGKDKALKLFKWLYWIGYLAILILLFFKVIPIVSMLTFGTLLLVHRHVNLFIEKQTKKDTFVLAVKNFVIMNVVLIVTLALGVLYKGYLKI